MTDKFSNKFNQDPMCAGQLKRMKRGKIEKTEFSPTAVLKLKSLLAHIISGNPDFFLRFFKTEKCFKKRNSSMHKGGF